MRNVFGRLFCVAGVALLGVAAPVAAQQAPAAPRGPEPALRVAPDGDRGEQAGGRGVEADRRVLRYGEWLRIPCTITSGVDGEFGAVRSVAAEILVGKTELSYTYTQPVPRRAPLRHVPRHARGAPQSRPPRRKSSTRSLRQLHARRRCRTRAEPGAAKTTFTQALANMEGGRRRRRHPASRAGARNPGELAKNLGRW